jgi:hypothetical protein
MKSVLFVGALIALLGGAVAGCGPKKPYCPNTGGPCPQGGDDFDAGTPGMDAAQDSSAVILD